MNTILIEHKGKRRHYRAPSDWNELTRAQLFNWCGIVRQAIPLAEAMNAAVMLLYGIPLNLLELLNVAQRVQLAKSLDFLQRENKLTANVIGRMGLLGRRYYGPSGRMLSNLTIGEYRRTELYYQLWLKEGDIHLLRLLAATLFRPKGNGRPDDVREAVSETRINRRARLFRLVHPNWIHAVQLYYEGCRAAIRRQYPRVYVKSDDGGKKEKANDKNWKLVDLDEYILGYSGDKLGNYAETMNVNLHVFFKHMTQRLEEYERLKRERERA